MGALQSWCYDGKGSSDDGYWQLGSAKPRGGATLRCQDEQHRANPARPVRSRPQMILSDQPQCSDGVVESKYEMISEIGHGSTSVVYRCCERKTGKTYACKLIDRRLIKGKQDDLFKQFQVEIQVLQSMKHANIIHIEDVYITDSRISMVTEYMNGGELFDYVVQKGTLSEVEASAIVRKITSAIAYMHSCGVVHRDLKPENLMLTSKAPGAEVKIIDFGLAKLLDDDNTTRSFLGTRGYLAPEMLQRRAYTKTVDIWALGVIVYILLCGCLPFNDDGERIANDKAARAKFGLRFPRWANGLSESARDLLRNLLEVDSTKRYTAEQALNHPWVTGQKTPNKYLRSPNYLRTMKRKKQGLQDPDDSDPIMASRRLSH